MSHIDTLYALQRKVQHNSEHVGARWSRLRAVWREEADALAAVIQFIEAEKAYQDHLGTKQPWWDEVDARDWRRLRDYLDEKRGETFEAVIE